MDSQERKARSIHREYSAACFNRAWELLEKPDRTAADDEEMEAVSHASYWHWLQREDCTMLNKSIGAWQISRVYAVLGNAPDALRFGRLCLGFSQGLAPFYLGYAHECLARAALVEGNLDQMRFHLTEAHRLAAEISAAEDRQALEKDLESIR